MIIVTHKVLKGSAYVISSSFPKIEPVFMIAWGAGGGGDKEVERNTADSSRLNYAPISRQVWHL